LSSPSPSKTKQSFAILLKPLIEQKIIDALETKREGIFGMGTKVEVEDVFQTGDIAIKIIAESEVSLCPYHRKKIESANFKKITLKKTGSSIIECNTFISKEMVNDGRLDIIGAHVDNIVQQIKDINFSIKHDTKNCAICAYKIDKLIE